MSLVGKIGAKESLDSFQIESHRAICAEFIMSSGLEHYEQVSHHIAFFVEVLTAESVGTCLIEWLESVRSAQRLLAGLEMGDHLIGQLLIQQAEGMRV